jgi:hypothetical protein
MRAGLKCQNCGKPLAAQRATARYCGSTCRSQARRSKARLKPGVGRRAAMRRKGPHPAWRRSPGGARRRRVDMPPPPSLNSQASSEAQVEGQGRTVLLLPVDLLRSRARGAEAPTCAPPSASISSCCGQRRDPPRSPAAPEIDLKIASRAAVLGSFRLERTSPEMKERPLRDGRYHRAHADARSSLRSGDRRGLAQE